MTVHNTDPSYSDTPETAAPALEVGLPDGAQTEAKASRNPAAPIACAESRSFPQRCPQTIRLDIGQKQCSFVRGHEHPHGACVDAPTGVAFYITWGVMASPQQPTVGGTPIHRWQSRAAEWTDSRFPDDTLEQRGLVLGEETGEVLRCILKAKQDIRGGTAYWLGELPSEVVDVFFCLLAIAHRAGFDLERAIENEWDRLAAKVYEKGASDG